MALMVLTACGGGKAASRDGDTAAAETAAAMAPAFDADSAYGFVACMVEFGPRVPNTDAHRRAGDWLAATLRGYGWEVTEQNADLKAFDGTLLKARTIFAQINPEAGDRLLLLAHWDCRPWADQDPDPAKRKQPVDGANDGASGVGVLLEIARQLGMQKPDRGVDILFVDAEDWGADGDDDSWALGTRYFAENPPKAGYRPTEAILLDMVGSEEAQFGHEYFSRQANPGLIDKVWSAARALGHGGYFHNGFGGAITDDHVQLIEHGIPAIDIIDYRAAPTYQGFDPVWHTSRDNMDNISPTTLRAVGETLLYIISN